MHNDPDETYCKDNHICVPVRRALIDEHSCNRSSDKGCDGREHEEGANTAPNLVIGRNLRYGRRSNADEDAGSKAVEADEYENCGNAARLVGKPHGNAKDTREKRHRTEQVQAAGLVRKVATKDTSKKSGAIDEWKEILMNRG